MRGSPEYRTVHSLFPPLLLINTNSGQLDRGASTIRLAASGSPGSCSCPVVVISSSVIVAVMHSALALTGELLHSTIARVATLPM